MATKLPKIGEKKYIMATKLSKLLGRREKLLGILACQKWRGEKKNCGNEVAENWRSHSTLSYSYSPETFKYIEYILYSFPIKPTDITHIEFMSCIDSFFSFYFSSSL